MLWDSTVSGFGVRCLPGGTKTFVYRYRPHGDRRDVVTAIGHLTKFGKPDAAGDLRKFSRTLLEWAVSEGLAKFNVMAGLRAPAKTRAQRLLEAEARGKALSDAGLVVE